MFNLVDLLLAMGFAWMISGISLIILNQKKTANIWPAIHLLLVFGLTLLDNFLKVEMLPEKSLFLLSFSRNAYFLIGPFLLLYTWSLVGRVELKAIYLLNLLPFVVTVIHSIINPSTLHPLQGNEASVPHSASILFFLKDLLSVLLRAIYCAVVLRIIRSHARSVPDFYSRKTFRNTLSWLYYVVLIYLVLFLFNSVVLLIPPETEQLRQFAATIVRLVPSLLFIFFFALFAQNQPLVESAPKTGTDKGQESDRKYRTSGLDTNESGKVFQRLQETLTGEKLYLNPDLTLGDLAGSLGESRHRLSEVINSESGENFYGYINDFRLKEFFSAIDENRFPVYTILAVALECGFKSTSAFYSFFRKKTGKTPREYMKEVTG